MKNENGNVLLITFFAVLVVLVVGVVGWWLVSKDNILKQQAGIEKLALGDVVPAASEAKNGGKASSTELNNVAKEQKVVIRSGVIIIYDSTRRQPAKLIENPLSVAELEAQKNKYIVDMVSVPECSGDVLGNKYITTIINNSQFDYATIIVEHPAPLGGNLQERYAALTKQDKEGCGYIPRTPENQKAINELIADYRNYYEKSDLEKIQNTINGEGFNEARVLSSEVSATSTKALLLDEKIKVSIMDWSNYKKFDNTEVPLFGIEVCSNDSEKIKYEEFIRKANQDVRKFELAKFGESDAINLYITPNYDKVAKFETGCSGGLGAVYPIKTTKDYIIWGFLGCSAGAAPSPGEEPYYQNFINCENLAEELRAYFSVE